MIGSAEGPDRKIENPFVGPRPFEVGERLWGRDPEIRRLDNLLSAERIVLLHSPSGAGKSSLVRAGLLPRLENIYDIWGITRFNQELPPSAEDENRYIWSAIQGLEAGVPARLQRSPEELVGQTLRQYVERRPRRRSASENILLIFDQFEEILTVDPLAVEAKLELFAQLGGLLRDPKIWALFILREDYLAPLDPYAQHIPTHLKIRFRIDLLGLEGAYKAMVGPVREQGREFPAAQQLARDLATVKVQQPDGSFLVQTGHHVEPVHLQVVCRRLWQALPAEHPSIGEEDLKQFGDAGEALAGYYADSVHRCARGDRKLEREMRQWFEDQLIANGDVRGQVLRGTESSQGLANDVIADLLDTHLVRAEFRGGATWYELAHDRLIEPVRSSNRAWNEENLSAVQLRVALWEKQGRPTSLLVGGEELAEAERWADDENVLLTEIEEDFLSDSRQAQAIAEREERQRRWIQRLAILATIVGVLALTASIVAFFQWRQSQAQAQKAQNLAGSAIANNLLVEGKFLQGNLLALETASPAQTPAAVPTLQRALAYPVEATIFEEHEAGILTAAWSPDGEQAVTVDEQAARVWQAKSGATISTLEGHGGPIESVSWHPDGSRLVTASADSTARIWEVESGQVLVELAGHRDLVSGAVWNPSGSRIATVSQDFSLRLWEAETGTLEHELAGHEDWIQMVDWHPEGSRLVTASRDRSARIWDAEKGVSISLLSGHDDRLKMAIWSPDGELIATASHDATARIWDGDSGTLLWVLRGHQAALSSIAWSPDGARLVTTSADRTARIWDVASGTLLATLEGHSDWLSGAAWSPDGGQLVTASFDGTARLWNQNGGDALAILGGHLDALTAVSWNPTWPRLITTSMDHTARVWNMELGEATITLEGHQLGVEDARFAPDGSRVLTSSRDSTARIWDPRTGALLTKLEGHTSAVSAASWSPDGHHVATASADRTVRLWESSSGTSVRVFEGHEDRVGIVTFSRDGSRLLAAGQDRTARVWDVVSGKSLCSLVGHEDEILAALWSPEDSRVLTASSDTSVRLWQADGCEQIEVLYGHLDSVTSASWSPDGSRIATGSKDAMIRLWDADSGAVLHTLQGHESTITSVAFSPDGSRLVSASLDQRGRIWEVGSGEAGFVLSAHQEALREASWSPDGSRIVTVSLDRTARVWDSMTGEEVAVFEGHRDALRMASWHPDGSHILTASRDGTARLWANALDYPEYLQARIRARTQLCTEVHVRCDRLGESIDEAQLKVATCNACVQRFFGVLQGAPTFDWPTYVDAWRQYQACSR